MVRSARGVLRSGCPGAGEPVGLRAGLDDVPAEREAVDDGELRTELDRRTDTNTQRSPVQSLPTSII
jgi:hypothetical protein